MSEDNRKYYAHTDGTANKENWQALEEHLTNTANLAKNFGECFESGNWAYLAGLWHDIGKYSDKFQRMLNASIYKNCDNDKHESISKIDHSTAGAQHAAKNHKESGKILAYVIAGHHGGIPDGISSDSCLRTRLKKDIYNYNACPEGILNFKTPQLHITPTHDRAGIQFSFFIRMLYSCLVDADFLDTEAFMDSERAKQRKVYKTINELEEVFFEKLNEMRQNSEFTFVNQKREEVLAQCLKASQKDMGFFSLTVPTGGGKTLSSMAFALRHAKKHNLKRIIYVIPFTSIIEQNAEVFREKLGDDAVLEHHSNFEIDEENQHWRLAAENWDAPIIVTTNVQFFQSLFSNKPSRCRKLHNIAGSVIILDEVQTLPAPYLIPCIETLKELANTYKTTIVLCSATQPAIQYRDDFLRGLKNVTEIINNPIELTEALKRININILNEKKDLEIAEKIKQHKQVLCIVNTRKHAKCLYSLLGSAEGHYHLSALMCPAHRSIVLAKIRNKLVNGETCRVISTQLIEAGVDIDFPVVYRAMSGIDSIAQAAGRCNREGKLKIGEVFIFFPENGIPAGHLRQTAQAAESVLRRYSNDILSLPAIEDYFRLYYWTKGEKLDQEGILDMLKAGCAKGDFPFKSIAEKFRFIKDDMKSVVIPFDKQADDIIKSINFVENPLLLSRKLQRYIVSIYPNEWEQLYNNGNIELKANTIPLLINKKIYRDDLGLLIEKDIDPENFYV